MTDALSNARRLINIWKSGFASQVGQVNVLAIYTESNHE